MSRSSHILIVDDDREIRSLLSRFLQAQGFVATTAASGKEIKKALTRATIDLVVLDRVMPGEDGLEVCHDLRRYSRVPVILLTLLGSEEDRLRGFDAGCDDYVTKPFSPQELLRRIRAVLRRSNALPAQISAPRQKKSCFEGWTLNHFTRELSDPAGALVALTEGEFELLEVFLDFSQTPLSRDQLLGRARGRTTIPFDRSIDMQIARLRRKIEVQPDRPELIRTLRNKGYMFIPRVAQSEE